MNKGCLTMATGQNVPTCIKLMELQAGPSGSPDFRLSSISQEFRQLRIMGLVRSTHGAGTTASRLQVNGNGEITTSTLYDTQWTTSSGAGASGQAYGATTFWDLALMPTAAHTVGLYEAFALDFPFYNATDSYKYMIGNGMIGIPAVNISQYSFSGQWRSFEPITSMRFYPGNGSFALGSRVALYGLN